MWQPIETAPKAPHDIFGDGPRIVLFQENGVDPDIAIGRWESDSEWWSMDDCSYWRFPSHWMPLPEPPPPEPETV